jgi:YgiT-type zinc finger domain-containing protein
MDRLPDKKMNDFECHVCGNQSFDSGLVDNVFEVEDRRVLVEHVPARVCRRCGEPVFSADTAERVRRLVHSDARPSSTVPLDVFEFA